MAANKAILGGAGLLAVLVLGVFIGALFRVEPNSAGKTPEVTADAGPAALEALRSENFRLKSELAGRAERPASATPDVTHVKPLSTIDQLRVLADLSKRRLLSPMIRAFNYSEAGVLAPSFVELFGLSAPEQATLQSAVDRARERIASLELENASVERASNGDVAVKIRPFAQAGGVVYDELIKAFAETLGPDRQAAFLVLAAGDVEKSLGWFGTAERTLTFSRVVAADGGTQFKVQAQHKLPTESGSQSSSFKTFAEMAAWAGTPVQLLPKDFGQRK